MFGLHLETTLGISLGALGALLSLVAAIVRARSLRGLLALDVWLRCAGLLLLGVAASNLSWRKDQDTAHATVLLDVSESVDEVTGESLLQYARKLAGDDLTISVQPFGRSTATVSLPIEELSNYHNTRLSWSKLDSGATNIESALRSTLDASNESIILISDGHETSGDVESALTSVAARGNVIFPLVPTRDSGTEQAFRISRLHSPLVAPAKKSVEFRASIKNSTTTPQEGVLEIRQGAKTIAKRTVVAPPGEELLITAESDPSLEGMQEIVATLTPAERAFPQSIERVFLSTEQREKVLLLSGSNEDEGYLKQALTDQSYQLTTSLEGGAPGALNPAEYSVVILNNIPKDRVPPSLLAAMDSYVRRGGGLIMAGGNRSFGLGGYINSSIESLLPVELMPPQTTKKRLNVAVAMVMDKSGSMSQAQRLDFAKEAANQVIQNLKDDDYVTVVGFDDAPFVVIKLTQVGAVRADAADRISRLFPAGRTNMLPAIDEGRRNLARAEAGRKHIIILTDGRLPDEGPFYTEMIRSMRLSGITVSTVLLGGQDSGFLKQLADAGGGGYYETDDPRTLPRIFLQDVKVSTGERTMKEAQEFSVRRGPGELRSTAIRNFPNLRGYVQTRPRTGAELELVVAAEDKAEPLLASWRVGEGKVVAFTSDANGRWSDEWVSWPRFHEFWSGLIESVRTTSKEISPQFDLRPYLEGGELRLDLAVFSETEANSLVGTLVRPTGEKTALQFTTVAKGLFRASDRSPTPGRYEFHGQLGKAKLTSVAFNISGELFAERKNQPFNRRLLEHLASSTGGGINPTPEMIRTNLRRSVQTVSVAHWPALAALIFVVLSVLFREVPALRNRTARRSLR